MCDASSFGGKVLKVVSFNLFNAISIYCNERVSEWKEWFQRLFCKRKNAKNVFSLRTLHLIPNLPFSLAHLEFLCHACVLIFTRDTVFETFSQQGSGIPKRKSNQVICLLYPLVSLCVIKSFFTPISITDAFFASVCTVQFRPPSPNCADPLQRSLIWDNFLTHDLNSSHDDFDDVQRVFCCCSCD